MTLRPGNLYKYGHMFCRVIEFGNMTVFVHVVDRNDRFRYYTTLTKEEVSRLPVVSYGWAKLRIVK